MRPRVSAEELYKILDKISRLVPLGTVIEVKRGNKVLRLTVRDTQAKRFGHLIDIPSKTWDKLGAKRSIGMLKVEWRKIKK